MSSRRDELHRHYQLERRLADHLRRAAKAERRGLYAAVYAEIFREFPGPTGGSATARATREHQAGLELRLLDPFLGPAVSMIEFGSGGGDLSVRAASRVRRVCAVDVVDRPAPAGGIPANLTRLVSEGPPLPLADSSCDLAYSCHFVEHLHPEDLADHISDVHRLLVPGGRYICVTPNRLLGPHDVSKHFTRVATGLHLREYTHRELARTFRRAAFTSVEVLRTVGGIPEAGVTRRYLRAERLLGWIPRPVRLALLSDPRWFGRQEPFRRFEQVKIMATK